MDEQRRRGTTTWDCINFADWSIEGRDHSQSLCPPTYDGMSLSLQSVTEGPGSSYPVDTHAHRNSGLSLDE